MRNALAYLTMRRLFFIAFVLFITHAALLPGLARADITHGLIGWWKFDEGTSTNAHDSSGYGNNGTLSTTGSTLPKWVNGKRGSALQFDGADNWVQATSPLPATVVDYTQSAWLNIPTLPGTWDSAIDINDMWMGAGDTIGKWACNENAELDSANNITPGWHLLTCVWKNSNSSMTMYVDGAYVTSQSGMAAPGSGNAWPLYIGAYDNTSGYFNGTIDDVRIYNRALSAADVAQLYASGETIVRKPRNNLGLIGYWSFNEGTSTIAHDFSGNGNTGTLSTTGSTKPQWVSGKRGQALNFDGSTSYVDAGARPSLNISGAITVSAWIKPTVVGVANSDIVANMNAAASTEQYELTLDSGGAVEFDLNNGGAQQFDYGTQILSANNWYHIVATRDAGNTASKIYINGVADTVGRAGSGSIPTSGFGRTAIGRTGDDISGAYFPGIIDDVRIYNRQLSASEVANLYQSGATRAQTSSAVMHNGSSLQSGLVGHWTFDGKDTPWSSATAGTAIDRSGNNSNGILTQMNRATSPTIGKLGQALNFDGVTNYVNINAVASKIQTGSFSVAFWFMPNTVINTIVPGWAMTIFGLADFSSNNDIQLQFNSGHLRAGYIDSSSVQYNINTSQASWAHAWYHAVYTFDINSGDANIYINGVSSGFGNHNNGRGTTHYAASSTIGTAADGTGYYFYGTVDDVRVYNRALSASEVYQLFKLGQSTVRP